MTDAEIRHYRLFKSGEKTFKRRREKAKGKREEAQTKKTGKREGEKMQVFFCGDTSEVEMENGVVGLLQTLDERRTGRLTQAVMAQVHRH